MAIMLTPTIRAVLTSTMVVTILAERIVNEQAAAGTTRP